MLQQLRQLRDAMYQGYYVLDTSKVHASRPNRVVAVGQQCKLQSYMNNLEAILDGMKEFSIVLMQCPPLFRQPYSAYIFMESCMFGRSLEKERIINFLLRPHSSLDILPVIGPCYVGKRTLVEHACREELVQRHFMHILHFSSGDLNDLTNDRDMDNCRKLLGSNGRFLAVVELVHDIDVTKWGKLYRHLRNGTDTDSSKVILLSRMDRVSGLGTVQALCLTRLHQVQYWYFFRVLAFGSANPYDHHPNLGSIAKEIAMEIDGSFMIAATVTNVLRANMHVQFWRSVLGYIRKAKQMHMLVFGEDPRDAQSSKRHLSYFRSFRHDGPLIFCYSRYTARNMMQGDMASGLKPEDVLNARDMKYGEKFDIINRSHIPPYYYYIAKCVVENPRGVGLANKCLKRKRTL